MYSQLVKTCDESYIRSLLFNGGERNFSSNFNDRFHLSESFSVLFCHCNRKFTKIHSLSKQFCTIFILWKTYHSHQTFPTCQSWHQLFILWKTYHCAELFTQWMGFSSCMIVPSYSSVFSVGLLFVIGWNNCNARKFPLSRERCMKLMRV